MVSYAARLRRHAGGKHLLRGVKPFPLMHRVTTGPVLMERYAQRKLQMARARQNYRARERPDDQEAIKPADEQPGEDGDNEPRISGARLEEMLKLAGAEEVAA